MAFLQAFIAGLIALIIAPGYLFYFDVTPKLVVLLAGAAAAVVFIKPARSRFGWLAVAIAASLVLSSCLSTNPALSWFGSNWRRFGTVEQIAVLLLAWLAASCIGNDSGRLRIVLRGVAVAALLVSLYGILQYAGIDPLLPAAAYHVGEGKWTIVRPPATLGYVSYFANWLAMAAFCCLLLARLEPRPVLRRAAYAVAAFSGFALLLTGTRGAILAVAAGCVTLFVLRAVRITPRAAAFAAVALAVLALFYFSPAGWNLHARARWFREDARGGARLDLWRDSLSMSTHRPLAGFGPEVFTAEFPHFESVRLAQAYPDFAHESPHNMFLDALVAQGIPGFVLLAALCGLALACAPSPWFAAAIVTAIVAHQFTAFTIPTAVLFYLTLALASAERAPQPRTRPIFAAIPVAAALLFLAFRFTAADHALELTRRSIDSGNGAAAAAHFADFERWRPPGAGSDLWYSRAMSMLAQRAPNRLLRVQIAAQAGYAALRATHTAEDPFNAWYHTAALYASANDPAYAERSLRSAIAAHPHWFKPHWMLARILRLEGRNDEAHAEAALALDLDAGKHAEVRDTLESSVSISLQK